MKIKLLLFALSVFAVFFLSSQIANAGCTYSNPLYAKMTPLDKADFRECVNFNPASGCDSACGPYVSNECEGTKIKGKDTTACFPATARCWFGILSNSEITGYTYTYKDCAGEPVNKKCYGGACVQCLSDADCTLPQTCKLDEHRCVSPSPTCTNPSGLRYAECTAAGCAWCAPPTYSGYCAASPSDCTAPCTKDSDCKSSCDDTGCNLNINKCSYGKCVYSGTSKFCGYGTKGCAGSTACDTGAGSCGSGGSGGGGYTGSGCSWVYEGSFGRVCSSGCPPSYPNQQWVECRTIPGCKGDCGCGSYDPIKGETPC